MKLSYVHGVGTTPLIAHTIGALNGRVQKFKMREITVAELALDRVTEVEPT